MINPFKIFFFLLSNRFTGLIPEQIRRAEVDGVVFDLDLTQTIDRHLYYAGAWEPKVRRFLRKFLTPDMVVFDIGANVGAHALPMAKILSKGSGRLFAFEPSSFAYSKLQHNIALNNFGSIHAEKTALWDKAGSVRITRSSPCFRSSWNIKRDDSQLKVEEEICTQTVDAKVAELGIERLDFVKMDTDGHELKILSSATETLSRFRPVLLVEIGHALRRVGDRLEDLLMLFDKLEYNFLDLESLRTVTPEEILESGKSVSFDYICVPGEKRLF